MDHVDVPLLCIGIQVLANGLLAAMVSAARNTTKDGRDDKTGLFFRRQRAHINHAEFAPLLCLSYWILRQLGRPSQVDIGFIIASTAARLLMAFALSTLGHTLNPLRLVGAATTYVSYFYFAYVIITRAL